MATPTQSMSEERPLPNGAVAAALLAGGIGAFAVGLMTVLAEASEAIANLLRFSGPVGPLSGKTTVAVVIWLIAWGILGVLWRGKNVDFGRVSTAAFMLLALGLLGTFPPFFVLFAAE
ncbi:MAG TPA: hypothetical protein VI793_10230 [Anaerolineales bacterium]|nr:hypothetical protein [Anaerolineales bacterium]